MCGRYTLLADEVDILQEFSISRPIEGIHQVIISHLGKMFWRLFMMEKKNGPVIYVGGLFRRGQKMKK
ncbi:hypothetical protein [Paracerasibacillus soli]|uniref:SOS response-associated peptidase n=1 Tax=Paracerasibacillus soli TaxID=480284 RepID=A0ABU5CMF7_9BACI|nr:hypothetical protein [Virgibacillus soli]MDY0407529.1 hypothetical protein [Virgibacillus soli]